MQWISWLLIAIILKVSRAGYLSGTYHYHIIWKILISQKIVLFFKAYVCDNWNNNWHVYTHVKALLWFQISQGYVTILPFLKHFVKCLQLSSAACIYSLNKFRQVLQSPMFNIFLHLFHIIILLDGKCMCFFLNDIKFVTNIFFRSQSLALER